MPKAKLSTLLVIVGLLIVVGLWLLSSAASPAALPTQATSGFPVDTPDFAAFATAFCCGDGTPDVITPSSEQVAYMTEGAQTQAADAATARSQVTDIPQAQLLPPSGEWTTYTDPNFGYSFEYPSNWFLTNDGSSTEVNNATPGLPAKDTSSFLSIWIGPEKDLTRYGSLEAYLADPEHAVPPEQIISQTSRTLPSGYEVVERQERMWVGTGALVIFLTNGTQLYEMHIVEMTSHYIAVAEHVVDSFAISE